MIRIVVASLVLITLALTGVQLVIAQEGPTLDRWLTWPPTQRLQAAKAALEIMQANGVVCPAALDPTLIEWLVSGASRELSPARRRVVTIAQSLEVIFQQAGCRASH